MSPPLEVLSFHLEGPCTRATRRNVVEDFKSQAKPGKNPPRHATESLHPAFLNFTFYHSTAPLRKNEKQTFNINKNQDVVFLVSAVCMVHFQLTTSSKVGKYFILTPQIKRAH